VAEPISDLPGWHREYLGSLHEGQLDDSRLIVRKETLNEALRKDKEGWQALVIDADCALPEAGVTSREGVPHSSFLHRAHSSLKEGGLLAITCSSEHHTFERKMQKAGFDVVHEVVPTSQKGKQKQRSTIWLARKGAYDQALPYRGPQNK
jgi:spermidine synthase